MNEEQCKLTSLHKKKKLENDDFWNKKVTRNTHSTCSRLTFTVAVTYMYLLQVTTTVVCSLHVV